MKYLITENKLKTFLKKEFGVDFTGKIKQVTSNYDLPFVFDDYITPKLLNLYLNLNGPMYVIDVMGGLWLYQNQGDNIFLMNERGYNHSPEPLLHEIGIDVMGLSIDDLIDLYFEEEN
jgi:hypothetical protein